MNPEDSNRKAAEASSDQPFHVVPLSVPTGSLKIESYFKFDGRGYVGMSKIKEYDTEGRLISERTQKTGVNLVFTHKPASPRLSRSLLSHFTRFLRRVRRSPFSI